MPEFPNRQQRRAAAAYERGKIIGEPYTDMNPPGALDASLAAEKGTVRAHYNYAGKLPLLRKPVGGGK